MTSTSARPDTTDPTPRAAIPPRLKPGPHRRNNPRRVTTWIATVTTGLLLAWYAGENTPTWSLLGWGIAAAAAPCAVLAATEGTRTRHASSPHLTEVPGGGPLRWVTVLPSRRATTRRHLCLSVTAIGVVALTEAGQNLPWSLRGLLALIALTAAAALALQLSGAWGTGRIELGPHGITQHLGGLRQSIAWTDIDEVRLDPHHPNTILIYATHPDATHITRRVPPGCCRAPRPPHGGIRIDTTVTTFDARDIGELLAWHVTHPVARRDLGTPASLYAMCGPGQDPAGAIVRP